ncbi:MAG: hypothetical protein JY451_00895 [Erythrobacter sp.]|nr:MAG: hypothetical protein JY451_00895 [Erythrobacter sp.]
MNKTALIAAGVVLAGALAVFVVLPAEMGYDPTGVGEQLGLTEIADPVGEELERGMARMAQQDVLVLSSADLPPAEGVADAWQIELGPFESVEFKYTMPEGAPMTFRWQASAPVAYDMHAHPFEGGEELTESYGVDTAQEMRGTYTPAFTGIHGWFWENRSMDTVTLTLAANGQMSTSTIFQGDSVGERPIEGATAAIEGKVAGHQMQSEAAAE